MNRYIWVTTQKEGLHRYIKAPEGVKFLSSLHRHIFKLKIWLETRHDNREVEFILFKRYVESLIKTNNFNNKSCEMISNDLYGKISNKYPNREIWIEVSEDGENGSFITYEK